MDTQDAGGKGMGGIWFPALTNLLDRPATRSAAKSSTNSGASPLIWQATFNVDITSDLVSHNNPSGTIINNDLELAASLMQHDITTHQFCLCKQAIASGSSNMPVVAWQLKAPLLQSLLPPSYCSSRHSTKAFTITILQYSLSLKG
jgi:hypothetical protein